MKKVLVMSTGGTIEKSYHELEGKLENRESIFKDRLLSQLRLPHTQVTLREIMAKDSLDMTDEDRQVICRQIESHFAHDVPIVILHGTDTMEVTAKHCFDELKEVPVPVVFTGAMRPMGFVDSDGPQNIIEALMAAQLAEPGFYVSFHGRLFNVPNVTKDQKMGTFREIQS